MVVTLPLSEYFDTNAQPDMANINRKKANVMRPVEYQNGEAFTIRNVGLCLNPFRLALRHWLT
ncbi:plasmid segregation protein parM [Escherichia coli BCE030_MS-09]|nr:plasmid segregation protein parM [Escherichia coli BCE030_MS-09]